MAASSLHVKAGDGIGGEGITVAPKDNQYGGVVIWLHGLGDTAMGWYSAMAQLSVKNTKFILPTATSRPIAINNGFRMPGWSDVYGLSLDSREDAEGFDSSAVRVGAIIAAERANGVPANKIVVGGFSQGGALALHVALRYPETLGGCVACSGWLPLREAYPAALSPTATAVPILMGHGTSDMVVQFSWGQSR
ncbi:unnamed protein product [Phaeothamnion confervicola]